MKDLTHVEIRLFEYVQTHGRKHPSFYYKLMGQSKSSFKRTKWILQKKGYIITKRKVWIDIHPDKIKNGLAKKSFN